MDTFSTISDNAPWHTIMTLYNRPWAVTNLAPGSHNPLNTLHSRTRVRHRAILHFLSTFSRWVLIRTKFLYVECSIDFFKFKLLINMQCWYKYGDYYDRTSSLHYTPVQITSNTRNETSMCSLLCCTFVTLIGPFFTMTQ